MSSRISPSTKSNGTSSPSNPSPRNGSFRRVSRKRPIGFPCLRSIRWIRFSIGIVAISILLIPMLLYSNLSLPSSINCQDKFHQIQLSKSSFINNAIDTTKGARIRPSIDNPSSDNNSKKYTATYTLQSPPSQFTTHYNNVLHTVTTRFMVGQPAKYLLARARFLLFETFCYPTMYYQTNQNFYWIILVDPGIHSQVVNDMQTLLQNIPTQNAYMVMTNNTEWVADGVGVENVTSYGVNLRIVAEEYRLGNIEIKTGNKTLLLQALDMMDNKNNHDRKQQSNSLRTNDKPDRHQLPTIMVIETLLDADDGMNNQAIQWIQDIAIARTQEEQQYLESTSTKSFFAQSTKSTISSKSLNDTWWFFCGTDHIEWHNRDIFTLSEEEYASYGLSSGLAAARSTPFFCTSAGFTRIGITETPTTLQFPKDAYSNHALAFYFPQCTKVEDIATIPPQNVSVAHCYRRELPGHPFILKSRSITSDSMDNMNPKKLYDYSDVPWINKTENVLRINETELTWELLGKDFSIDRYTAWKTSLFLYQNRKQILIQNKISRCIPGFPCYKTAKKHMIYMERYWLKQQQQGLEGNDKKKLSSGKYHTITGDQPMDETKRKEIIERLAARKRERANKTGAVAAGGGKTSTKISTAIDLERKQEMRQQIMEELEAMHRDINTKKKSITKK